MDGSITCGRTNENTEGARSGMTLLKFSRRREKHLPEEMLAPSHASWRESKNPHH